MYVCVCVINATRYGKGTRQEGLILCITSLLKHFLCLINIYMLVFYYIHIEKDRSGFTDYAF